MKRFMLAVEKEEEPPSFVFLSLSSMIAAEADVEATVAVTTTAVEEMNLHREERSTNI